MQRDINSPCTRSEELDSNEIRQAVNLSYSNVLCMFEMILFK